jgi:MbtH protein
MVSEAKVKATQEWCKQKKCLATIGEISLCKKRTEPSWQKRLVFRGAISLLFPRMSDADQDQTIYNVVLNHEEQYSIWPADRECPLGWRKEGKSGTKDVCLAYINEVWTDMRPLSVRKQMEASRSEST